MIVNNNSYRYERKLIVDGFNFSSLETLNNIYDLGLSEIYEERRVNSIYYDTNKFFYAKQHLDGFNKRLKCRVRFYGDIKSVTSPFLEFKSKNGYVGKKYKIPLKKNELLKNKFCLNFISNKDYKIENLDKNIISFLYPKLFVTYLRRYYLSKCLNYRFTFDKEIYFYLIETPFLELSNIFNYNSSKFKNNIIEIKYTRDLDQGGSSIIKKLPFRLTDCSKYIQGLNKFGII